MLLVAEITLLTVFIICVLLVLGLGAFVLFAYGPETFARVVNTPFEMIRTWRRWVRSKFPWLPW